MATAFPVGGFREARDKRKNARRRDRGGIFQPLEKNTMLDMLMARRKSGRVLAPPEEVQDEEESEESEVEPELAQFGGGGEVLSDDEVSDAMEHMKRARGRFDSSEISMSMSKLKIKDGQEKKGDKPHSETSARPRKSAAAVTARASLGRGRPSMMRKSSIKHGRDDDAASTSSSDEANEPLPAPLSPSVEDVAPEPDYGADEEYDVPLSPWQPPSHRRTPAKKKGKAETEPDVPDDLETGFDEPVATSWNTDRDGTKKNNKAAKKPSPRRSKAKSVQLEPDDLSASEEDFNHHETSPVPAPKPVIKTRKALPSTKTTRERSTSRKLGKVQPTITESENLSASEGEGVDQAKGSSSPLPAPKYINKARKKPVSSKTTHQASTSRKLDAKPHLPELSDLSASEGESFDCSAGSVLVPILNRNESADEYTTSDEEPPAPVLEGRKRYTIPIVIVQPIGWDAMVAKKQAQEARRRRKENKRPVKAKRKPAKVPEKVLDLATYGNRRHTIFARNVADDSQDELDIL